MIPFNKAIYLDSALKYVTDVATSCKISGNGKYTKLCSQWMEKRFNAKKILLTTSCTSALEMSAILLDIHPGDEVIMPSYTFVSTANAFVLYGAKIVFVDIRPDTMNINENLIEDAISEKTKAVVIVHYAGVACEMDKIKKVVEKYGIPIIEDAAQGVMASYKGRALGTIGDLGCYSFHETKNYTMGEGGALVINNEKYIERAEIIWEKGTNRTKFYRGEVDKYSWIDKGSSFLPSEFNVSYLYGQLEIADKINDDRKKSWEFYYKNLEEFQNKGFIRLPVIPKECIHNAHMFYIKFANLSIRSKFIDFMKKCDISCVFHYVPLHSSNAGKKYGIFLGNDLYTTKESSCLVRLPLYYKLSLSEKKQVINKILQFINKYL